MIKKITNISDQGIICDFGEEVNKDINKKVISLFNYLKEKSNNDEIKGIYNIIPSYNKLVVHFDLEKNNSNQFQTELQIVHEILNNAPYEELLRAGNNEEGKIILKYLGIDEAIDELIIFGRINTKGFVIIRVLGKDMSPNKIITLGNLIDQLDFGQVPVNEVMEFF